MRFKPMPSGEDCPPEVAREVAVEVGRRYDLPAAQRERFAAAAERSFLHWTSEGMAWRGGVL